MDYKVFARNYLMKVLLLTTPYEKEGYRHGESLGINYLAAFIQSHEIDCDTLEPVLMGFTIEQTVSYILNGCYDFLGISCQFSKLFDTAKAIIRDVRAQNNSLHISLGGHFATFHAKEILSEFSEINSIVMYEGEYTLLELLSNLQQPNNWKNILGIAFKSNESIIVNKPRPLIKNLDELPFPKRTITSRNEGDPHYNVITSRGCLMDCSFCSVPAFYGIPYGPRWRTRTPENVINEIEQLVRLYGAKEISFLDDNFIGSNTTGRNRAFQISEGILESGLKIVWGIECRVDDIDRFLLAKMNNAGLRNINLGIESGDQRVLDRYNKLITIEQSSQAINILKEFKFSVNYHFIMFNPDTSIDEIVNCINFLWENKIASYSLLTNKLEVYKGTQSYDTLLKMGKLFRQGFQFRYEFLNKKIDAIYYVFVKGLQPFEILENALKRAFYSVGVNITTNNNSRWKLLQQLAENGSDEIIKLAQRGLLNLDRINYEDELKSVAESIFHDSNVQVDIFMSQLINIFKNEFL